MRVNDFERLLTEHAAALYGLALRLTRSRDRAWDLVQDTLERALRKPPVMSSGGSTRAWLLRVMRNYFLDQRRHEQSGARALAEFQATFVQGEHPEHAPAPSWADLDRSDIDVCLGDLDRLQRAVFDLHVTGLKTYREISAELNIPSATVGTRLYRARRRLRTLLRARILARAGLTEVEDRDHAAAEPLPDRPSRVRRQVAMAG
jgi:RNA polymerase sigma-70 factor, ECF subfamily